jgi:hypothetical protein
MSDFRVPLFLRGEVIEEDWTRFGGRGRGIAFEAPDPAIHVERLPLASPLALADLYEISFDEILDVLEALGQALDFEKNEHVRKAYEAGLVATNYPASILDGRELRVRAFGARALHIPAGNGGLVSAITIIRNAITRSDAIVKVPSNDPLTAVAIARTLANVAPNHPLTKHLAVAYWKGGDEDVERRLFRPEHVEKVVAWGGFASVKHVTRYIQPGLEMIALDPKRSATIIGPEAFESEQTLDEVALRAACDIGMANQEACASARVIYVLCGSDSDGIAAANRLGERIYEKLQALPEHISTKPKSFDRELRDHIEASRMTGDWFRVIGGEQNEGAIIVSQMDEPVDYSPLLSGRVANLVPVDDVKKVTDAVNAYTQTVGAQRLTSLGYACHVTTAMPQDAIEPLRRMCKWIVDEECDPEKVFPAWKAPALG